MTTSSHAILGVAQDHSLLSRAKALGAGMGLTPMEMDANALRLGSLPVNADGDTVASVYEYAASRRQEALDAVPPPPGEDPAAVTDAHLVYALSRLQADLHKDDPSV